MLFNDPWRPKASPITPYQHKKGKEIPTEPNQSS